MKPVDISRMFLAQLNARKPEIFVWTWSTSVGCLLAGHGFPPVEKILLAVSSITALAISGYTYNDIADLEADALNEQKKRIRPLPSGKLSAKDAIKIVWFFGFLGFFLAVFTTPMAFLLTVLWAFLLYSYSNPKIRLKKRFLCKEFVISIGFFLAILIGALSVGELSQVVWFVSILMFAFSMFLLPALREALDIEEDKINGVKSLSTLIKLKTKVEMAILFIFIVMTLTPLTYANFNLNVVFPLVTVATSFIVLRFLFPLLTRFDLDTHRQAYRATYAFWLGFQISLVIGTLPLSIGI